MLLHEGQERAVGYLSLHPVCARTEGPPWCHGGARPVQGPVQELRGGAALDQACGRGGFGRWGWCPGKHRLLREQGQRGWDSDEASEALAAGYNVRKGRKFSNKRNTVLVPYLKNHNNANIL